MDTLSHRSCCQWQHTRARTYVVYNARGCKRYVDIPGVACVILFMFSIHRFTLSGLCTGRHMYQETRTRTLLVRLSSRHRALVPGIPTPIILQTKCAMCVIFRYECQVWHKFLERSNKVGIKRWHFVWKNGSNRWHL